MAWNSDVIYQKKAPPIYIQARVEDTPGEAEWTVGCSISGLELTYSYEGDEPSWLNFTQTDNYI